MIALARIARGIAARITIIALGVVGLSAGAAICAPSPNTPASSDASKPAVAATTSKSSDAAPLAPAAVAKTQSKKDEKPLEPISKRFAAAISRETPSFQRHVAPLLGKLGCNGRACHGSFQGRGGFRLSLFGYDFKMDHDALMAGEEGPRVNVKNPDASLILQKPTLRMDHEGGKRYKLGSWEHHVLLQWIQGGAPGVKPGDPKFVRLEVRPAEIRFAKKGEKVALRAIAHWSDGTSEDVTPLCRYQSNDEQIAKIDTTGQVTSVEPGDSHVVAFYDAGVTPVPGDAAGVGRGRPQVSRRPHADRDRPPGRAKAPQAGDRAVGRLQRRRVSPPGEPRRDGHPADGQRGRRHSWPTSRPTSGTRRSTSCSSGRRTSPGGPRGCATSPATTTGRWPTSRPSTRRSPARNGTTGS